jgi:hypothetical protein
MSRWQSSQNANGSKITAMARLILGAKEKPLYVSESE